MREWRRAFSVQLGLGISTVPVSVQRSLSPIKREAYGRGLTGMEAVTHLTGIRPGDQPGSFTSALLGCPVRGMAATCDTRDRFRQIKTLQHPGRPTRDALVFSACRLAIRDVAKQTQAV